MNSDDSIEKQPEEILENIPVITNSNPKMYLNRRERLEQRHERDLQSCQEFFESFVKRHNGPNSNVILFNKILEVVKVPFSTLPSLVQIKDFYQNYVSRERRRKYMKKGLWNEKELKILLWSLMYCSDHIGRKIDDFLDSDWNEVSHLFPNTTGLKCKAKWHSIKKSKYMKTKWSFEEDQLLNSLMGQIPERSKISWNDLATTINNSLYSGEFIRTGRHCRDRWVHHLNPQLSKLHWSNEEDLIIIQYVAENGKKWAKLAKEMQNRNEDSIRNRFIKLMKLCRNREKLKKNDGTKSKTESTILQKLLAELANKSTVEEKKSNNNDEMNAPKMKREREHSNNFRETTSSIPKEKQKTKYQTEAFLKVENIEMKKNSFNSSKPQKKIKIEESNSEIQDQRCIPIEEKRNTMIPNSASNNGISNINQMTQLNYDQNRNTMGDFWQFFTVQNQLFAQEMMFQRTQLMFGNYLLGLGISNTIEKGNSKPS